MIVVSIKSATMARQETEPKRIQKELERIEQEQKRKEEQEQQVVDIINYLKDQIDKEIKNGKTWHWETITCHSYIYRHLDHYFIQIEEVLKAFREAGYKATMYPYSDSWTYKSGKICNIEIEWSEQ